MTALSKHSVIKFYCATCEQKLSVPAGLEGQKFSCPNCAAPGHVPGSAPTDLRLNGESLIKFFCLHCGQKLSCEGGAGGQVAKCPVCNKSTPVPAKTMIGTAVRTKKKETQPLNGKPNEEPEVVLGPDPEPKETSWTAASGTMAPSSAATKTKKRAVQTGINGATSPQSATKSPFQKAKAKRSEASGVNGSAGREQPVAGSTSLEELFESLEDLGFEVEKLSSAIERADVKRDPEESR